MQFLVQRYDLEELWKLKFSILNTMIRPNKIINLFKNEFSKLLKLKKVYGLPPHYMIEPCRNCNYKCTMCSLQLDKLAEQKNDNPIMSFEQFKKIVDEIGPYAMTVRLWHFGEPLLNKDLFKMVRFLKKYKIFTLLSSNLELLTPIMAEDMIDSGLDYLLISLDAATEKTFRDYTGVGDFSKVIENLRYIVDLKKKKRSRLPFVNVVFVVMKSNEHEVEKMKRLAKDIGVDKISFKAVHSTMPDVKKNIESTDPRYRLDTEKRNQVTKWCETPFQECIVCANGETVTCGIDVSNSELMGNVFNESVRSIWNGEKFQKFRDKVNKKKSTIEICKICQKADNQEVFVKT